MKSKNVGNIFVCFAIFVIVFLIQFHVVTNRFFGNGLTFTTEEKTQGIFRKNLIQIKKKFNFRKRL